MKSAEESIRAIQADTLRHAAAECRRRKSISKNAGYNTGCEECAIFIEAEAAKLEHLDSDDRNLRDWKSHE